MALKDKLKIMIVDDMTTSRGLVFNCLDTIGVKNVCYAKTGVEALSMLKTSPVHLIISDYNMPEMDGLGLLKSLRANPATKKIGFILLTGSKDASLVEKGRSLGMNNFLAKPFTPKDLETCISAVVGSLH